MNKGNMSLDEIREKFGVKITEGKHLINGIQCNYEINWDSKVKVEPFCTVYRKEDNRESRIYLNNNY